MGCQCGRVLRYADGGTRSAQSIIYILSALGWRTGMNYKRASNFSSCRCLPLISSYTCPNVCLTQKGVTRFTANKTAKKSLGRWKVCFEFSAAVANIFE